MSQFGPHQIGERVESVGPFKVGKKRVMLWKFHDITALLSHVGFLQKYAVGREELEKLITHSLPMKCCTVASLAIANTCEDQLGFAVFHVTPKKWVMRYAVVDPTVHCALNPIEKGDWGTEIVYATYDEPLG